MFVAQISLGSSSKTKTSHDIPSGIKTIYHGMKATQFDQDKPNCWIYAVKVSMIGKYWNDTTALCCSTWTTCIKSDQKGRSCSNGLDKPHHSWAPSICRACMVWGMETPYETDQNMDQVTALFQFLQHIWFPHPSLITFIWFVARHFWLEYRFINDSIFGDSMVGSPYWISGHLNFQWIFSAHVKK